MSFPVLYNLEANILLTLLLYTLSVLFPPARSGKGLTFNLLLANGLFFLFHFVPVWFRLITHYYNYQTFLSLIFAVVWSLVFLKGSFPAKAEYILFYLTAIKCFKFICAPLYSWKAVMNPVIYRLIDVTSFLLLCLVLWQLALLFRKHPITHLDSMDERRIYVTLFCPLSFLLILILLDPQTVVPDMVEEIVTALLLLLNLPLMYYLVAYIIEIYEDRLRLNRALMESEGQLENYRNLIRMEEQVRKERHELKNNYFYLLTLLKEEKKEKAEEFLRQKLDSGEEQKNPVHTGNNLVDYILNQKIREAGRLGIKTVTDLMVPSELPVDENALCTILLNLLDNALEASRKIKEPDISITIRCIDKQLLIRISNRADPRELASNPELKTTKADAEAHGFGLTIVAETVQKNDGICSHRIEDGYFTQIVMLPFIRRA